MQNTGTIDISYQSFFANRLDISQAAAQFLSNDLTWNASLEIETMMQGQLGHGRKGMSIGHAPDGAASGDGFDAAQFFALTHQEYGHCAQAKTLHERLSDSGAHAGQW